MASMNARRITRWALRGFWTPVGAGVMPPADVVRAYTWLFNLSNGAAAAYSVDEKIGELPGLSGVNPFRRWLLSNGLHRDVKPRSVSMQVSTAAEALEA
jgi:hypothetical protein